MKIDMEKVEVMASCMSPCGVALFLGELRSEKGIERKDKNDGNKNSNNGGKRKNVVVNKNIININDNSGTVIVNIYPESGAEVNQGDNGNGRVEVNHGNSKNKK